MDNQRNDARLLADDEMASYGLHPAVHEELVRWHNPALTPSIAAVQQRIRRRLRHSAVEEQLKLPA